MGKNKKTKAQAASAQAAQSGVANDWRSVPFLLTNKFYVQTEPLHVRLAFGEEVKGLTTYQQGVLMTRAEAQELASLITRLLAPPPGAR